MPYRLRNASGKHQWMDEPEEVGGPPNPILAENMRRLMRDRRIGGIGALRDAMKEAELTIGTSTIQRAVQGQGGNRLQSLSKIARFFDVTTDQLLQPELGAGEPSNVAPAESHRRVPLISWVQAGLWQDVVDNFHPGEADEWALAFDSLPGKHAFALRVVGDSMTNPIPGARSFPEGTVIIVDPGRAAGPGDFVVAKDTATQQATFKQLTTDGGRWFLRPLNPSYPTVEIDDPSIRVIGRVIEFQTRGKL